MIMLEFCPQSLWYRKNDTAYCHYSRSATTSLSYKLYTGVMVRPNKDAHRFDMIVPKLECTIDGFGIWSTFGALCHRQSRPASEPCCQIPDLWICRICPTLGPCFSNAQIAPAEHERTCHLLQEPFRHTRSCIYNRIHCGTLTKDTTRRK